MSGSEKSIPQINDRIAQGKAVVLTDREFLKEIKAGRSFTLSDVDVVTTAYQASTSGTSAMLCVPVTDRGVFTRARRIWLNGVSGVPGPAPNERLGLVDTTIFSDQPGRDSHQSNYSGAQLILDIISKKEIRVECLSVEGDNYWNTFTLDKLQFARMYVYNYFLGEPGIPNKFQKPYRHFEMIRAGSKILLNKAPGILIGCGTRSTPERKALSLAADMFEMDPGVVTELKIDSRVSLANSLALAIPIISDGALNDLREYVETISSRQPGEALSTPERAMSQYLKELILSNRFSLIDSDIGLQHWIQK
jgi:uncharacterized protein (DUF39 family)